jgi:hypothetical protein
MASAMINGKRYVASGVESPLADCDRIVASLLVYTPGTNRWTRKAPMLTARAGAAGAAATGKFFVMGGRDDSSALRKVEAYTQ